MSVKQILALTEASVDTIANTSQVKILWVSIQSGESWNGYTRTAKYYVSINGGAETEYSVSYTLPQNSKKTIVSVTITVPHLDNGTGSVRVRTWMDTGISAGVVEKSQTLTLTPITRVSVINYIYGSDKIGDLTIIRWYPKSTEFKYKLKFSFGSWGYTSDFISPKTTGVWDWYYTIPYDICYAMGASEKTATIAVTLYTYTSNGVQIGDAYSTTFKRTMPDNENTQPTVSMSVSPLSTLNSPYNSLYIQGISKVKASLVPTTKYGATVVASSITVNGKTYADPYESDILAQEGKVTVKATVKDSRGFYGTYYQDIDVIPYSKPYVRSKSGESSIIAARCDASANFTDSGTYLKIKAKVVYSKVIANGKQLNYGNIRFRYRQEGGAYSAWQTILDGEAQNSDEVITPPLLNGALDVKVNYQVQVIASDDFYESEPFTAVVPSDEVCMDRPAGGKSMGLGGYAQGDGKLDVYWKTMARGGLSMFDSKGNEIPLDSTLPIPRDQVDATWNPDNLECGIYAVTSAKPLKSGDTVIMYNGVLIQMMAYVGGNVKIQLALTSDETRNPYYRVYWYGNWGNWRSLKL